MKLQFPGSLHDHSEFSNLRLRDCIVRVEDLLSYANELGHEVVALTDHEAISGHLKALKAYKKIKEKNPNFKLILGNEIYLCRNGLNANNFISGQDKYFHFILLAKDPIGHQQIREISTRAWTRSYMARGMRRVPTYYQDLFDIIGANPGHVIGATACLGGALGTQLLKQKETKDQDLYFKIGYWCQQLNQLFGQGNFYLEMQPSTNKEQVYVNNKIIELSEEFDIPFIITTDTHYLKKEDRAIHKAYLNAKNGDREVDDFYATTYLMNTEELESYMKISEDNLQKAYQNILNIKNMCEDYSLEKPLKIPQLPWKTFPEVIETNLWISRIPYLEKFANSDYVGDRELFKAIVNRIKSDNTLQNKETYDELNENLKSTWISSEVNNTHWSSYFLNLQKIIDGCWEAGSLVGPGRGSGAGFLLLYVLGITQINPLREETKCFGWRFLNPERVSVLDIDTDIESGRRGLVLEHLRKVYGYDRVAGVATFGTEKAKSAILTAARGLGIDVDIAQYLSSMIESDRGQQRTLHQTFYGDDDKGFYANKQFVFEMTENYPELWAVAQKIEGLVYRMGVHAGGVIFVDEPFTNSAALMRAPDGTIITQFELHDAEELSLIKYDLLSVNALDRIHNCIDLLCECNQIEKKETLRETYENIIGVYNLERTAPEMWKMVQDHKIMQLFQMEQQSGIQGIALAKPTSVKELAVLNSVIRLMAPEKGAEQPLDMWSRYREDISYWHDEMRTYGLTSEEIEWLSNHSAISDGICESQEGMMSLIQEPRLGGHSLTFADSVRKGVAKKVGKLFDDCQETFYKTIEEKGLSTKLGHYVWDVLLRVQRG